MFDKILVVCLGNICRSPTAQFLLQAQLPHKIVASAGITAMRNDDGSGWEMCAKARATAAAAGQQFASHEAQQLKRELIGAYDVILVMDQHQRNYIATRYPEAHAKTFLLGHWLKNEGQGSQGKEIPDPYKKSDEVYQHVYHLIESACASWTDKLK